MVSLLEARVVQKYTFSHGKEGKSDAVRAAVSQLGLLSFTPGSLPTRWPQGYSKYAYTAYQHWPDQISQGDEDKHALALRTHCHMACPAGAG